MSIMQKEVVSSRSPPAAPAQLSSVSEQQRSKILTVSILSVLAVVQAVWLVVLGYAVSLALR
jgi:hypothetical protein